MSQATTLVAGRYQLGATLGRGGMADVHAGHDLRLGREVAVKVLRADLARDPLFRLRFEREAQNVAGLNHPGIVAVYDTGEVPTPRVGLCLHRHGVRQRLHPARPGARARTDGPRAGVRGDGRRVRRPGLQPPPRGRAP